jgi:hypothetical protein
MKTMKYDALPIEVRGVNDKLVPALRDYGYRGFFSTEIRVTRDHKAYVIDPCCRCGAPPHEIMLEIVENWADIIWHGSMGEIVEPIFAAKWGAELLLISDWADTNWLPVEFPASIRDRVKLRYLTMIEKKFYCVPQASAHPEIGAVVGLGDTMDDAIKDACSLAEQVKGFYLDIHPDSLNEAENRFRKLHEFGIQV